MTVAPCYEPRGPQGPHGPQGPRGRPQGPQGPRGRPQGPRGRGAGAACLSRLVVGELQSNCYVLTCSSSGEAAVIDPGGDGPRVVDELRKLGARCVYIINTHGHADHMCANAAVAHATGAIVVCHEAEARMLTDPASNLSSWLPDGATVSPAPGLTVRDGDRIEVGQLSLEVLHTPGHTPGSMSLVLRLPQDQGTWVFTGDTLFAAGVGRTDLPGGSEEDLIRSIRTKLFLLPGEAVIYPGHGPSSTIMREMSGW